MPKWGLSMTEATLTTWRKSVGDEFSEGEELADIETSKITGALEAPFSGRLAKIVASPGDVASIGALLAVAADASVAASDIEDFVEHFQSSLKPKDAGEDESIAVTALPVKVNGRDYRVNVFGPLSTNSVPIVLIHGFSSDINSWMLNIDALKSVGSVVALELPGHGASNKDVLSGSLTELADVLWQVLASIGVTRCDLIGHSLGGSVAMRLALDHSKLVRSLILISPAGLPESSLNRDFTHGVAAARTYRQLAPVLRMLYANPDLVTRQLVEDVLKFKRLDGADRALSLIAARMAQGDDFRSLAENLSKLPSTTVVFGDHDQVVERPRNEALPSHWELLVVHAGHVPHIENAQRVNELLTQALLKRSMQQ